MSRPSSTPDRLRRAAERLADLPPLVTIPEAARALSLCCKTIRRLVGARTLQSAHIGVGRGAVRITRTSLIEYLARQLD